ncbi:MAG: phosphatase PAP2 family protein [Micrococcaceae bacterium]
MTDSLDMWWWHLMIDHRNPFLTSIALIMNYSLDVIYLVFLGLIIYYAVKRQWHETTIFGVSFLIQQFIFLIGIKNIVRRQRPPANDWLAKPSGYSFPSGHNVTTAALMMTCVLVYRKTWVKVMAGIVIVLMMWSRPYLGVHWLTDVVFGMLFGVASAYLAVFVANKFFTADSSRLKKQIT